MLQKGAKILDGRFTLCGSISVSPELEVWEAVDTYDAPVLVKSWPFVGARPDDLQRALWDLELRNLFRLANLPDAESSLVTLIDAGIDFACQSFVMVLKAPGLVPLEALLEQRRSCGWLRDVKDVATRCGLWHGLRALAEGLALIHDQHMLHRSISASTIFCDRADGPLSMRLGGFEWTVRLGTRSAAPSNDRTAVPPVPPELDDRSGSQVHSFESDWFHFGALAARVVAAAEPQGGAAADAARMSIVTRVRQQQALLDIERDLIERLLTTDPAARLARGSVIDKEILAVIRRLEQPARLPDNAYLALVPLLGPTRELTARIIEQDETIKAYDVESQRAFIEADLVDARMFGQTSLIRRRKNAIARLKKRAYLLRAILFPDFLSVDTRAELPLPIDSKTIDDAKKQAMQYLWRTRPIFALQGPPGTGKTTMVANLLAQVAEP